MEKLNDDVYKLVLPYQYEIPGSYGNVIFNSNGGQQFDAGVITPGQKMIYTADGKWIPFVEPVKAIMGDVNRDGKLTITDVTAIQRVVAEYREFDDVQTVLADVDGDGKTTIQDATLVQRFLAEYADETGSTGETVAV